MTLGFGRRKKVDKSKGDPKPDVAGAPAGTEDTSKIIVAKVIDDPVGKDKPDAADGSTDDTASADGTDGGGEKADAKEAIALFWKDGEKAGVERRGRRRLVLRGAMLVSVLALAVLPGSTFDDELVSNRDDERDDDRRGSSSGEIDWELGIDTEDPDKGDLDDFDDDEYALDDADADGEVSGTGGRSGGDGSDSPIVDDLTRSGVPEVAMRAYRGAEATTARSDPSCGLRWSLLAAIGRVESNHGRYGGAQLRADGYGTRPIRGIPLDGRPGVALIRDTDDGRFDGDTVYDRAVGPMQFIPSSWPRVAADGNGDGEEDPNNIFDAALGAASYLCSGDRDLRQYSDRYAAVRSYNHSDEYVRTVLSLADNYERNGEDLPQVGPVGPSPTPGPNLPQTPDQPASVTPPPQPGNIDVGTGAPNTPAPADPGPFPPGGPPTNPTVPPSTRPLPTGPPVTPQPPVTVLPPCPTTTSTSSTSSTSSTTTSTVVPTTTTTWPAHCPTTTTSSTSTSTTAPASSSSSSSSEPPTTAGLVSTGLALAIATAGIALAALTGGKMLRRRLQV